MCCILCLTNEAELITIDAVDGPDLSVLEIIQAHIWWQSTTEIQTNSICKNCWQSIWEFHKFYLRVQTAHKDLKRKDIANQSNTDLAAYNEECVNIVEIKIEECDIKQEFILNNIEANHDPLQEHNNKHKMCIDEKQENSNKLGKIEDIKDVPNHVHTQVLKYNTTFEHEEILIDSKFLTSKFKFNEDISFSNTNLKAGQRKEKTLQYDKFIASNLQLVCPLCNIDLANFTQVKAHFRSKHNTNGYIICCGKKFLHRGLLVDHLHLHRNPNYFKCTICKKVLADRRLLKSHLKAHKNENRERIYQCNECAKRFFCRFAYQRHLLIHVPETAKNISCPECNKTFAAKYIMNKHLKHVHLNTYAKVCELCGKLIQGYEALRRHKEKHEGKLIVFKCDICGIKLTTKYGLKKHLKVKHSNDKLEPKACNLCSKIISTEAAYERHMKYTHLTERKYKCSICDKAFKKSKSLKEHMATHFGNALYSCSFCTKTFNSNANMYAHRKKVHHAEWQLMQSEKYSCIEEDN